MVNPLDLINGSERVSDAVKEERMSICRACPELFQFTTSCKRCGCFMNAKTRLAEAECPLKKWGAVERNQ